MAKITQLGLSDPHTHTHKHTSKTRRPHTSLRYTRVNFCALARLTQTGAYYHEVHARSSKIGPNSRRYRHTSAQAKGKQIEQSERALWLTSLMSSIVQMIGAIEQIRFRKTTTTTKTRRRVFSKVLQANTRRPISKLARRSISCA